MWGNLRSAGLLWVAAAMFLALEAAASLTWPFSWDHAIFAAIGDVINDGGVPYRDAWEMRGPFPLAVFAAAQRLFGRNMWGIRVVDLLFAAWGAAALFRLAARQSGKRTARWAAIFFLLWYASLSYWHTAQPEAWVAMMMLAALEVTPAPPERSAWRWAVAGGLTACMVLTKPFYLVFLPVLLIRQGRRGVVNAGMWAAGGCALPLAAAVVWFAHRGALGEMVDATILYSARSYAALPDHFTGALKSLAEQLLGGGTMTLLLPAACLGAFAMSGRDFRTAVTLMAWLGAAVAAVVLQGRYFAYHWIPAFPPLVLLAASGLDLLRREVDRGRHSREALVFLCSTLALVAAGVTLRAGFDVCRWGMYMAGGSREGYYAPFHTSLPEIQAAEYLARATKPEDRIVTWGWNAAVGYLAGRRNASRFAYSGPLVMGRDREFQGAFRKEFLADITRYEPAYIVVGEQPERILGRRYEAGEFPELARILDSCYAEDRRFGPITLHRRLGRTECMGGTKVALRQGAREQDVTW